MENFQVYRDIQARTGGDIYIGVVGPVRTGKSTFIRRFMELVALPDMEPAKQAEVRDQRGLYYILIIDTILWFRKNDHNCGTQIYPKRSSECKFR